MSAKIKMTGSADRKECLALEKDMNARLVSAGITEAVVIVKDFSISQRGVEKIKYDVRLASGGDAPEDLQRRVQEFLEG